MDNIKVGRMYAVLIGALGLTGLFASGHLFELMNVDMALDVLRIALAAYLVYAAFITKSHRMTANGLLVVGILYIGMGIWGLFSSTLGGLLPSGLTGFDIVFHLVTGAVAVATAMNRAKTQDTRAQA